VLEPDRLERAGVRARSRKRRVDGSSHPLVIGRAAGVLTRGYAAVMADPKTEEMRVEQLQRARSERDQADEATESADEQAHRRRAERAAYLKDKLDERAKSEEES
jgi:hypothetical protein